MIKISKIIFILCYYGMIISELCDIPHDVLTT